MKISILFRDALSSPNHEYNYYHKYPKIINTQKSIYATLYLQRSLKKKPKNKPCDIHGPSTSFEEICVFKDIRIWQNPSPYFLQKRVSQPYETLASAQAISMYTSLITVPVDLYNYVHICDSLWLCHWVVVISLLSSLMSSLIKSQRYHLQQCKNNGQSWLPWALLPCFSLPQ